MTGVRLEGIVKAYGAVQVVHGIDLEVQEKEFVVLVGPSGCGKSTTLRMIAGLEEISDGDLTIDGRHVNRVAPKDRDVAMVFQNYALYPHLNVADNIAFGLRIRKESKDKIASSVEEVGQILGLTPYLERRPADLSGGQRQRVAMGRAIVRRPKVFLFDEPLSNLDAKLRTQMRAEIKRLHKRLGATSIYVTHDQVEAMTLADRIVVMHDGRIEQIGSPMELFLNPANTFVAGFLGSPPMNMVTATVIAGDRGPVAEFDGQRIQLQQLPSLQDAVGRQVTLGIRPEFVTVAHDGVPDRVAIDVDLVETLGSEALIHASLQGAPFVIRTETVGQMGILDGISGFTIAPHLVKVFDADTGEALPGQVLAQ
ncbi:ABC transporter ATP-binding protein [Mameliella sediminis]|uniref:ABC transporter ATP-binding protein n=1 Tax=Mameliella sediminis TaxID=2836866 RepID=UPI001C46AE46|nr:sn-glycerol-3-phosphate ABC transporter ATP-binding protein UgpC [Mameliella sediminis]MBY6116989.1 sn-glycerol-3-phosphate ABC transporter ATP-binding protein UgpC [Antarctobacter heliothermus]MBY6146742.1 sn-glycerol-3-phosphate ABC transporter ATP-binding protein UgpC [Mameliella alba]MBV7397134.1 sn-glycerol-3-phosphate ABC transporter ATP-binding protein UgpC [Mameliella sediminis]MBY6163690.1 sn-glycerol-3-phosphate ABC transporter ATP-binding protein UgpC [Mameliella alba]MBY6171979.